MCGYWKSENGAHAENDYMCEIEVKRLFISGNVS